MSKYSVTNYLSGLHDKAKQKCVIYRWHIGYFAHPSNNNHNSDQINQHYKFKIKIFWMDMVDLAQKLKRNLHNFFNIHFYGIYQAPFVFKYLWEDFFLFLCSPLLASLFSMKSWFDQTLICTTVLPHKFQLFFLLDAFPEDFWRFLFVSSFMYM